MCCVTILFRMFFGQFLLVLGFYQSTNMMYLCNQILSSNWWNELTLRLGCIFFLLPFPFFFFSFYLNGQEISFPKSFWSSIVIVICSSQWDFIAHEIPKIVFFELFNLVPNYQFVHPENDWQTDKLKEHIY